jgi:putative lipoprotein
VSGSISYRERIALPPGFVVKVQLLDVSRQDAPAKTVNSIELTPAHQIPIPYEIGFDKTRINPHHSYAVRGQILVEGRLWFTSTQVIPVITRGAARRVTPTSGCNARRRRKRAMRPPRIWSEIGSSRIFPGAA